MVDFVKSIPELRARVPVTQQWAYFETAYAATWTTVTVRVATLCGSFPAPLLKRWR